MAFWVVGGGNGGTPLQHHDGMPLADCRVQNAIGLPRCGTNSLNLSRNEHRQSSTGEWEAMGDFMPDSVPIRNLAFLVIREDSDYHHHALSQRPASPSIDPRGSQIDSGNGCSTPRLVRQVPLERTESGLSISSDASAHQHPHHNPHSSAENEHNGTLLGDLEAARLVRDHVNAYRRRSPDSQPERILRALINPKSRGADFQLDNDALRSIFSAANELFFAGRLTRRVTWDWSHSASEKYENHVVGTTALRRSADFGGWETLIVLSSPILRDTKYNRRLLISTFLHEMTHSFMFVICGLKAKQCGGHTEGFHQIAGIIDDWAGQDCLRLRDMEADLSRWQGTDFPDDGQRLDDSSVHRCMDHAPELPCTRQSFRNGHQTHDKHAEYRQPTTPVDAAHEAKPAGAWQWYEREGFGDRLQYFTQVQHVG